MPKKITSVDNESILFYRSTGEYGFLSNLYPCTIIIDEIQFKSSEFAYQYAKFRQNTDKEKEILNWAMQAPSSSLIAQLSHSLLRWQIVDNWGDIKVDRMRKVLQAKFNQNLDLKHQLIATQNMTLIENSKTDRFWGIGVYNRGENMLGKLLMQIRDAYLKEMD